MVQATQLEEVCRKCMILFGVQTLCPDRNSVDQPERNNCPPNNVMHYLYTSSKMSNVYRVLYLASLGLDLRLGTVQFNPKLTDNLAC
eukprot:1159866-Pelagomonas_calceolata.AAC.4